MMFESELILLAALCFLLPITVQCVKKKKRIRRKTNFPAKEENSDGDEYELRKGDTEFDTKDLGTENPEEVNQQPHKDPVGKIPVKAGVIVSHDNPEYQTMIKVNQDFGPDRAKTPQQNQQFKAPTKGGMAGTYDPNYQTLKNMSQEAAFGPDKKKPACGSMEIKKGEDKVVNMFEPNYQTLAAINNNVFVTKT